jgi:hypothetical protein
MKTQQMANAQGFDANKYGVPQDRTLIHLFQVMFDEQVDPRSPKKFAEAIHPRAQFKSLRFADGKPATGVQVKEFLTAEQVEGSDLVVQEIASSIVEAAQYASPLMDMFPKETTNSNSFLWPIGQTLAPFNKIAEGGEIKDQEEDPSSRTFTIEKYAGKARITREMIEDQRFLTMERETRNLGVRAGLTHTVEMVKSLLEGAGKEHDTAGSNQDAAALRAARAKLRGEPSYVPDVVLLHPEWEDDLIADTELAYRANLATLDPVSGVLTPAYGLKFVLVDYPVVSDTYTWGFAANAEIGGLVVSSQNAGGTVMNRELTLENFEDAYKDISAIVASMRFDTEELIANATCRVEY